MAAASSAFKIKCPSCEAMVTIRDPGLAGKKIDCNKCKYRFVVELPAGGGGSDDEGDDAPPKKAAKETPAKGKAKKVRDADDDGDEGGSSKSKAKPLPKRDDDDDEDSDGGGKKKTKLTLMIGGGLALLAIGVLIVYFVSGSDDDKQKKDTQVKPPTKTAEVTKPVEPPKEIPKKEEKKEEEKVTPKVPELSTDITNLLPGESQWVLKVNGPEMIESPIGQVLFEPASDSSKAFTRWMGFSADDVDKVVCSGGSDKAWIFGIIHLKKEKELKIEDLRKAMELATNPQTIKGRQLYAVESNQLFKMVGDYLMLKIKAFGIKMPAEHTQKVAICLLTPQTLIVAHRDKLEDFLNADAKRTFLSNYSPPEQPGAKGPGMPMPGMPMPPVPPKGPAEPPKAGQAPFTSNPTYLSIQPPLKTLMNQLEGSKPTVLTIVANMTDLMGGGATLNQLGVPLGDLIPKDSDGQSGISIKQMDRQRLNLAIADVYSDAAKAQEVLASVKVDFWARIASALFKVPVGTTQNPSGQWSESEAGKQPMGMAPTPASSGQRSPSTLTVTAVDKVVVFAVDAEWSSIYFKQIQPPIRDYIDLVRGEAVMMTGQSHWHAMGPALKELKSAKDASLPAAAYPRTSNPARLELPYPPDERVSWMVEMLPFLGHEALARKIDRQAAWNDEKNLIAGMAWVPEFLDPQARPQSWRAYLPSLKRVSLGGTNFVGLTGIGLDSGEYLDTPEYAKKLGLFGYNRRTKLSDITDGQSNTIFMIEVPPTIQRPWIRGGGSTVQGVPETGSIKPFVCTERDGKAGTYAMMADGSVRFLSESMDDRVFKALVTYKGGEKVDIDAVAPAENTKESTLKAGGPAKTDSPKTETKKDEPKKPEESKKLEDKKDEPKKPDPDRQRQAQEKLENMLKDAKKEGPKPDAKKEELKVEPKVADPKKAEPK